MKFEELFCWRSDACAEHRFSCWAFVCTQISTSWTLQTLISARMHDLTAWIDAHRYAQVVLPEMLNCSFCTSWGICFGPMWMPVHSGWQRFGLERLWFLWGCQRVVPPSVAWGCDAAASGRFQGLLSEELWRRLLPNNRSVASAFQWWPGCFSMLAFLRPLFPCICQFAYQDLPTCKPDQTGMSLLKAKDMQRTFNVLPSSIVQRQALSAIARTGFTMAKLGSGGTTGGGGLYGDGRAPRVKSVTQKDPKWARKHFKTACWKVFVGILILFLWCNADAADRGSTGMMIWYDDNICQEKQIDSIGTGKHRIHPKQETHPKAFTAGYS